MRAIAGEGQRGAAIAAGVVAVCFIAIATSAVLGSVASKVVPAAVVVIALTFVNRSFLRWRSLLAALIVVIFFIPIGRYSLPASLPIQLEPYRLLAALIIVGWLTSLLIDPRVRLRATGYEAPLGLFLFACIASLVLNPERITAAGSVLDKSLMFFASFLFVVYVVGSVARRSADIDRLLKVAVACGAVVAISAVVESRTHYNVFNHLSKVIPILRLGQIPFANGHDPTGMSRGGDVRAYASAEHPIALGAVLAMLVPLAFYLARRYKQRLWWAATACLMVGVFATVSRTGFVMLIVAMLVLVALRPRQMKRFWPALLPAIVLIHFAVPGTLGSVVQAFFPKGGLIAQEKKNAVGSGRLATLGPALRTEFDPNPIFGEGFDTRVTVPAPGVPANAPILDDQWANVLLETGVVGTFALGWFFVRAFRMAARRAREDDSDEGIRAAAFAASIAAFAFGMLTYDAFSFTQVTFAAFILMGLSAAAVRPGTVRADVPAVAYVPAS